VAPVIIATDKTQLTQFSGSKSAYPVYLTLGNIPKVIRRKPSQQACILIGYLSVDKILASHLTQKDKSSRVQRLFHDSMRIILEPLKEAGRKGMEVTGGDGRVRRVHPILACYVADYPEQCLVTCAKYGTCPKCQRPADGLNLKTPGEKRTASWTLRVIKNSRANSASLHQFHSKCQALDVSGTVQHPFWEGFPYMDIHLAVVPDVLHQLYQGVFKHMVSWCAHLLHPSELDARIRALPLCFGVRHFQNGWSALAQISGKERKDMARILLACLVGKVPSKVLLVYRSLLDFIYLSQYPSHDDTTLGYLQDALDMFHKHKNILVHIGIREHLDIPKIHSMVHYIDSIRLFGTTDNYNTEAFERLHIDLAKDAWRATNKRNERPQMVAWLTRREKVTLFQQYLETQELAEREEIIEIRKPPQKISLSKHPSRVGQRLVDIMQTHRCPGLVNDLKVFLNTCQTRGQGDPLSKRRLELTQVPFDRLNVYHGFKFLREELTIDETEERLQEKDWVRARPSSTKQEERFDPVVVMRSEDCEPTGVQGTF
jgi:hypothetical protein